VSGGEHFPVATKPVPGFLLSFFPFAAHALSSEFVVCAAEFKRKIAFRLQMQQKSIDNR
jgi:hypothetical protein